MVDKSAHYLMKKRGVYYFTRHVPNDLQRHYEKPRIVMCLKTRIQIAALKAIQSLKSKLDSFWLQMRISNMGVPVPCLLTKGQPKETHMHIPLWTHRKKCNLFCVILGHQTSMRRQRQHRCHGTFRLSHG